MAETGGEDGDGDARASVARPEHERGDRAAGGHRTLAPGTRDRAWEEHRYLCTHVHAQTHMDVSIYMQVSVCIHVCVWMGIHRGVCLHTHVQLQLEGINRLTYLESAPAQLVTSLHTDVAFQAPYSFWPEQADAQRQAPRRMPCSSQPCWASSPGEAGAAAGTRVPKSCPPRRSRHTAELPTCRRSRDEPPVQGRGPPP